MTFVQDGNNYYSYRIIIKYKKKLKILVLGNFPFF